MLPWTNTVYARRTGARDARGRIHEYEIHVHYRFHGVSSRLRLPASFVIGSIKIDFSSRYIKQSPRRGAPLSSVECLESSTDLATRNRVINIQTGVKDEWGASGGSRRNRFVLLSASSLRPWLRFSSRWIDPPGRVCVGGRKGAGGFDDFLKGDHVRTWADAFVSARDTRTSQLPFRKSVIRRPALPLWRFAMLTNTRPPRRTPLPVDQPPLHVFTYYSRVHGATRRHALLIHLREYCALCESSPFCFDSTRSIKVSWHLSDSHGPRRFGRCCLREGIVLS